MLLFHDVRQKSMATWTPGLRTCRVNTPADVRALWLHRLVTSPMEKLVSLLYGRLFPLHDLLSQAAAGQQLPEGPAKGELCYFPLVHSLGMLPLCFSWLHADVVVVRGMHGHVISPR